MRTSLFIFFILFFKVSLGQKLSNQTPFYDKDSVYISGIVKDEFGNPIENVMVLLNPFYTEKFDVTWIEKDTFFTNKKGQFSISLNAGQFSRNLYFKKEGLFTSRLFLSKKSYRIIVDNPILLFNRSKHFFDTKKIGKADLGLTINQALKKYKINLKQTEFYKFPNYAYNVMGLRFETADSSIVLLKIENYLDTTLNKTNILNKPIIGIGVAFVNGLKIVVGKGLKENDRKVYNEYFFEKKSLFEK